MGFKEEDYLQLSGLQHFVFCRRQWALIHIEGQWAENYRTVDGHLMHERVHDQEFRESRGDCLTVRGLAIHSTELGVSGQCDAVEFRRAPAGIALQNREGLWLPYPQAQETQCGRASAVRPGYVPGGDALLCRPGGGTLLRRAPPPDGGPLYA